MKIEWIGKSGYNIFVTKQYVKDIDVFNKDEIVKFIKKYIFKLRSKLKLCGFYKIKVYVHKSVGLFLEISKLDDLDLSSALDLRIVVFYDEVVYYETDDYFLIDTCNDIRFYNGKFFCIVDDKFNDLIGKCDFGRFIYGKEIVNLLNNSIIL